MCDSGHNAKLDQKRTFFAPLTFIFNFAVRPESHI